MSKITVKSSQDHYVVTLNDEHFSFRKDPTATQLLNLLYPIIEQTTHQHEKIQPLLPEQYHNAIQQIALLQDVLEDLSVGEAAAQRVAIEACLDLAMEWHYFLQDVFKVFGTQLPE